MPQPTKATANKSSTRKTAAQRIQKEIQEILKAGTPDMAQLLIDTARDPEVKLELRLRCAESVLDRVLGKAKLPMEGAAEAADGQIVITLSPELMDYAQ